MNIDAVAQAIWQTYAADTGHALPAGEADRLAQAAVDAMAHMQQAQKPNGMRGWRL